jgi:hypothetical protein
MNEHFEKWDRLAPQSLLMVGLGIALTGSSVISRSQEKGLLRWLILAILGLVSINIGVARFAEALKHRTLYDIEIQQLRED